MTEFSERFMYAQPLMHGEKARPIPSGYDLAQKIFEKLMRKFGERGVSSLTISKS
jgi:hypothetical protein